MRILVALLLLATFCAPTIGQGDDGQSSEPIITLTGRQVPYYNLTKFFFEGALGRYQLADQVYFDQYLERLGFKPGSPAAQVFTEALPAYHDSKPTAQRRQAVEAELVALVDDEPAYWARQAAWEREKAEALGDVYRELAESLAALGSSMDGIEKHIYDQIAPTARLVSDRPLGAAFVAKNDAFLTHAGLKRGEEQ